jgi:hypothetical protein
MGLIVSQDSNLRRYLIAQGLLKPSPVEFDPRQCDYPVTYTLKPEDVVLTMDDEGRKSAAEACAQKNNSSQHLSAIEELIELLEWKSEPRFPRGRMVGFERNGVKSS